MQAKSVQQAIPDFVFLFLRPISKPETEIWTEWIPKALNWAKWIERVVQSFICNAIQELESLESNESEKRFHLVQGELLSEIVHDPDSKEQRKWYFFGKPLSWNSFYCSHHLLCRTMLYNTFITPTWITAASKIYLGIEPNDADGINALAKDIQKRICPQMTNIILNSITLSASNSLVQWCTKLPLQCCVGTFSLNEIVDAFFELYVSFYFGLDWITKKAFARLIKANLIRSPQGSWNHIVSQLCDPITLNEINTMVSYGLGYMLIVKEMVFCIPVVRLSENAEESLDAFIVQRLLQLDIDYLRINVGILCELSYWNKTFFVHYATRLLQCLLAETKLLEREFLQNKTPSVESIIHRSLVCPLMRSLLVLANRSLEQKQYVRELLEDLLLNMQESQFYSTNVFRTLIQLLSK